MVPCSIVFLITAIRSTGIPVEDILITSTKLIDEMMEI